MATPHTALAEQPGEAHHALTAAVVFADIATNGTEVGSPA